MTRRTTDLSGREITETGVAATHRKALDRSQESLTRLTGECRVKGRLVREWNVAAEPDSRVPALWRWTARVFAGPVTTPALTP